MGLVVVGLIISYLCWVTKYGSQYWDKKSKGIVERRKRVQVKKEKQEKLTTFEIIDFYVTKIVYGSLQLGIYLGFIISIAGIVLWIIK